MEWYSKYLQVYEKPFAEAPQAVIEEVRRNLAGLAIIPFFSVSC